MPYQPYSATLGTLSDLSQTVNRLSALDAARKDAATRAELSRAELGLRMDEAAANQKLGLLQAQTAADERAANAQYREENLALEKRKIDAEEKRYADNLAEERRQNTLLPVGRLLYDSFVQDQKMSPKEANKAIADLVANDMATWEFLKTTTTLKNLPATMQWMAQQARIDKQTSGTVAKATEWAKVNDEAKFLNGLDLSNPENQRIFRMKQAEFQRHGYFLASGTTSKNVMMDVDDGKGNITKQMVSVPTTVFVPIPLEDATPELKKADFDRHAGSLKARAPWITKLAPDVSDAVTKQTYDNPENESAILQKFQTGMNKWAEKNGGMKPMADTAKPQAPKAAPLAVMPTAIPGTGGPSLAQLSYDTGQGMRAIGSKAGDVLSSVGDAGLFTAKGLGRLGSAFITPSGYYDWQATQTDFPELNKYPLGKLWATAPVESQIVTSSRGMQPLQ
jgi:hypothetical protein